MQKPIFYDPEQKRWKRLRRIIDLLALLITAVIVIFGLSIYHRVSVPELFFPQQRHPYRPLKDSELQREVAHKNARRKTKKAASDVTLNSGEGIRGALRVFIGQSELETGVGHRSRQRDGQLHLVGFVQIPGGQIWRQTLQPRMGLA